MSKPKQQHMSLILSGVALLVVVGIAVASFQTQSHSNLASNSASSTTSGGKVSGTGGKSTPAAVSPTPGSNSQAAGQSNAQSPMSPASQTLYFSPTGTSLTAGQTLTVQVRENSGTSSVNAAEANFSYPTDMLKFNSINAGSSAFSIAAPSTGGNGKVSIARGSTTAVTGDQLVATVSFTVLPGQGTATLAFTAGSAVVTSTDHKNLVSTLGTAQYQLQ